MNSPEPLFDNFFENFTTSIAASRQLLQKAHNDGSLIEGLVLYAAVIDGLLRNLIALATAEPADGSGSKQLLFGDLALDEQLFQHDESSWLNERTVYTRALQAGVIDEVQYDQLNTLYSFRNRVVHRFIVSDLAYSDLEDVLPQYELLYWDLIKKLEAIEQSGDDISENEKESLTRHVTQQIARKLFRKDLDL